MSRTSLLDSDVIMEVANDVMRPLHDGDNESDSDTSDFDAH